MLSAHVFWQGHLQGKRAPRSAWAGPLGILSCSKECPRPCSWTVWRKPLSLLLKQAIADSSQEACFRKPNAGFVSFLNYMLAWIILQVGTFQTNDVILLLAALRVKALVPFRAVPAEPPQPLAGICFGVLASKNVLVRMLRFFSQWGLCSGWI